MLRDEIAKYTELTGEDGLHTPIMKIGAYLDGYEKGLSVLQEIRQEISNIVIEKERHNNLAIIKSPNQIKEECLKIIDKYIKEYEE